MDRDPDYLDPEVLRERMASEPAVDIKPSRPQVRRVEPQPTDLVGAVRISSSTTKASFSALKVERPGVGVVDKRATISR